MEGMLIIYLNGLKLIVRAQWLVVVAVVRDNSSIIGAD